MQARRAGAIEGKPAHQHDARLRARPLDHGDARQARLEALAEGTATEGGAPADARDAPGPHPSRRGRRGRIGGSNAIDAYRRIAAPLAQALAALARADAKIVERIVPAGIFGEGGIVGIEAEGRRRCRPAPLPPVETKPARDSAAPTTRCRSSGSTPTRSRDRSSASRRSSCSSQQPLMTRAFSSSISARARASRSASFSSSIVSRERCRLRRDDSAFGEALGDALLDHLSGRSELFADAFGLAHQRSSTMSASRCS